MLKIKRPALLIGQKVYVAPKPGMVHTEVIAHFGVNPDAQRGFVTSAGDFVNRTEGAKIAIAAGQVPDTVARLHSEDLPEFKKKR